MRGTLTYRAGLFFVDGLRVERTRLSLLPGDQVEYQVTVDNKAAIERISHRHPVVVVAIVEHANKARSPLLPESFVIYLANRFPVGQRLKVRITLDACDVLCAYDMNMRTNDDAILMDL